MAKLSDKVAVVTGGNSGIGEAIARKFNDEGAQVVIFGRNSDTVNKVANEMGEETVRIVGDVTNFADLDRLFEETKNKHKKIDVLVVNAGIAKMSPIEHVDESHYDEVMDINLKGAFFTIKKALPLIAEGGNIILTSSVVNQKGFPGMSVYGASKAAVRHLARSLAAELAEKGIRVNSLSPGPIDTPIFDRFGMEDEQKAQTKESFKSMIPAGRLGEANEMATAALFLASEDASFVNGIDLAADGGMAQI